MGAVTAAEAAITEVAVTAGATAAAMAADTIITITPAPMSRQASEA